MTVGIWNAGRRTPSFGDASEAPYTTIQPGQAWGEPWATSWLRLTGTMPTEWAGRRVELLVDVGFSAGRVGFQAEGLAYSSTGRTIKGLNPTSRWIPVDSGDPGAEVTVFVEAAANPTVLPLNDGVRDFRPTPLGDPATLPSTPLYQLRECHLALFDATAWKLARDMEVLSQLMQELGAQSERHWRIVSALERALDALDPIDIAGTAQHARDELAPLLSSPAHASAHRLSVVGHAHIDSAWLWPTSETVRKVARTTANVLQLMDASPDLVYAMSQAQQFAWMKEHYPQLFERIRERVRQGRFVPVGGMWVESDTNMPSGESLVRQLVFGKRFFMEEFGLETEEVWLPDSFGYSAALPQLIALSGSRWMLTQKISWNHTNRFPHHTFYWEGIDGTRVLTHAPPADKYNAEVTAAELAHAASNFAEQGQIGGSMLLYGHGDGGGGPTREMLARIRRLRDLEGSPRVESETPRAFFERTEAANDAAPVWVGEMYLEAHRGTYTSQARTKQGNRRSERLLREAEMWATSAAVLRGVDYPYDELDDIWKQVLLLQFHDILPGSSIAWVHQEAETTYDELATRLEQIIESSLSALSEDSGPMVPVDAVPFPASGGSPDPMSAAPEVSASVDRDGTFRLDNGLVRLHIDGSGHITSIRDLVAGRELVPHGTKVNVLTQYRDTPAQYDAWDIDPTYRTVAEAIDDVTSIEHWKGEGVAAVRTERAFGSSTVVQTVQVNAGQRRIDIEADVDWHESGKLLRVSLPLEISADRFAAETQFGHVYRPTHTNTSWDAAKFEICAHRWVHVAEPDYGVAVINESTYGHDVRRPSPGRVRATHTVVGLSLLRAPRFPDPGADQERHILRYAVVPGASIADAVWHACTFAQTDRTSRGEAALAPLVRSKTSGVVVDTIKLADDRSGDVVVRVYEALGRRARSELEIACDVSRVWVTDVLERPVAAQVELANQRATVDLTPFEVRTLRMTPAVRKLPS
ncbi:alpha-mannosidase [Georgenia halophila]|uniref:alpha-mannosidase n=1 Tax=Georgenia halophila TaxID=620889 RepID=UPI0031F1A54C